MNILWITVSDTLTFHHHISVLVAKSARSLYALKTIRSQRHALWDEHVLPLSRNSSRPYASPAWWGYLKADERNRLQSVIKKAKRYGYLFPRSFSTLDELRDDSDEQLFSSSRYNANHVLHRLLPQPKNTGHNLRQRTHNLILPIQTLSNKTLVTECYFDTSINCVIFFMFYYILRES